MDYNDWMLFWAAFGAIGGTVGAVATAVAVIVALWQTKYANRKKLRVVFTDNVTVVPMLGGLEERKELMSIKVTNIGNRNVKVCSWKLRLPDGQEAIVLPNVSPVEKLLSPSWPITLEPEESSSQYWLKERFYDYMIYIASRYENRDKKIILKVIDSTDREYSVKTSKTLQEYYQEAKEYANAHS